MAGTGKQLHPGVSIGQHRRLELLVGALSGPSPLLASLLGMLPAVILPGLLALLPPFVELVPLPCGLPYGLALEAHAELVKGIALVLDDMEHVDGDGRLGEGPLHNGMHGVGVVHRHFFHLFSLSLRYFLEDSDDIICPGAPHHSYERAPLAVPLLVRDKREEVLRMHALVYAEVLADVLRDEHPVAGMTELVPLAEAAEVLLVVLLQRAPVNLEVALQRAGRYRVCIQIFFLRHPQIPSNSGCLRP